MHIHKLGSREWGKTIAVGLGVAVLTAAIMAAGLKSGVSPLPKPLGLAFAERLIGATLPLPVGLLFHTAWVTFFTAVYVALFRDALTFMRAFWLAAALWVLFSGRRLGFSRPRGHAETDHRRRCASSSLRNFPVGP